LLQFGIKKCKSMIVCKDKTSVFDCDLMVDNWKPKYEENADTGVLNLKEKYMRLTRLEHTTE
jgi:hypothetical protein